MRHFMGQRGVIALGVLKALERRHLHPVLRHRVESLIAAVLDAGTRGGEERFGAVDAWHGIEPGFGLGVILRGQAFHLFDVEHGVSLHEGNIALGFLAAVGVLLGAGDFRGVDDKASLLAFLHMRVQFKRLFEGQPDRRGESLGHGFGPKHQHVDSPVRDSIGAQGPRNAPGGMFDVPRLEPRADSLLKLGDNLSCDPLINIGLHLPSS